MNISFKNIDDFKKLLIKQGLSQNYLSKMAGITQSYLNQILNGKRDPGVKFCEKICTALNAQFDEIFEVKHDTVPLILSKEFHKFPFDFSSIVAKKVGLDESIIIQFLISWEDNNRLDNSNYLDGFYWVGIEDKKWKDIFIFWDKKHIETIVQNLINRGLVIKKDDLYRVDKEHLNRECI